MHNVPLYFNSTVTLFLMILITKIDLVVAGGVSTPSEQCQSTLEQGTRPLVACFLINRVVYSVYIISMYFMNYRNHPLKKKN